MSATVEVLAFEVVQAIQSLKRDIPLFANKKTAIRVYLRPHGLESIVPVTGTLTVTREGRSQEIESASSIPLHKEGDHPDLEEQRRSLSRSLCFLLEASEVAAGDIQFRLTKVTPTLAGDDQLGLSVPSHEPGTARFETGPTLSVRFVSLRVYDPKTKTAHTPNAAHRYSARSYLERAFPISRLEWSEITLDCATGFAPPYDDKDSTLAKPGPTWQRNFDLACAHMMAIRAREVEDGQDPRTRYYGVVYHPTDFFIGAASDVPATARPDIVGIGPADQGDGSYTGHELAHMLGRLHPGIGEGQSREDRAFPPAYNGRLSSPAERHHGFDVGDATHPPQVLPFDQWFDLMTYREPLWVSAYTYQGLLDGLPLDKQQAAAKAREGKYLHVIGRYELTRGAPKGELAYVFPGRIRSLASVETRDRVVVVGRDEKGIELWNERVELKRAAAADLPRDSGAFHVTVNDDEQLSRLELRVDGTVVSAIGPPTRAPEAVGVLSDDRVTIVPSPSEEDPYLLAIAWPDRYNRELSHTVQARKAGNGARWRTIATGITAVSSKVLLDRHELGLVDPEPAEVDVRILRAQGLSEILIYEGRLPLTPLGAVTPSG